MSLGERIAYWGSRLWSMVSTIREWRHLERERSEISFFNGGNWNLKIKNVVTSRGVLNYYQSPLALIHGQSVKVPQYGLVLLDDLSYNYSVYTQFWQAIMQCSNFAGTYTSGKCKRCKTNVRSSDPDLILFIFINHSSTKNLCKVL